MTCKPQCPEISSQSHLWRLSNEHAMSCVRGNCRQKIAIKQMIIVNTAMIKQTPNKTNRQICDSTLKFLKKCVKEDTRECKGGGREHFGVYVQRNASI